jgi:probable addiction module antidote protein
MVNVTPFDVSDHLDSEEMIAEYLKVTLEDEDPEAFIDALGNVAKAKGMEQIAKDANLSRENIRKALRSSSKVRADTIKKILKALNVKLSAEAADAAE